MKDNNKSLDQPIVYLTCSEFLEIFKKLLEKPVSPQKELPKFLTVPQLAELTGYSKSTINIKNSKKEIPGSKKLNGRVLFDTAVILNWIEEGAVKTKRERLQSLENNFRK